MEMKKKKKPRLGRYPMGPTITGETLPTYIDEATVRRYGIFGTTFIAGIKSEAISTDMTEVALWAPPSIKQLKKSIRKQSSIWDILLLKF